MAKAVLLVIDMLNDFFRQQPRLAAHREALVSSINGLTAAFRSHRLPVIWVRQEFAPDLSDAFLEMRKTGIRVTIAGTDGCDILADLDRPETDEVIVKKRYSAFFGTSLDEMLALHRPEMLVISGVSTHACVRATAIDAYQRDYNVVIATECVSSTDDQQDRTSRQYLGHAIARFMTNAEISVLLT